MSPKAKHPLGSAKAKKSIAGEYDPELGYRPKVLTFYDRGGEQKVRLYNKPLKPPTPAQRSQRNIIKDKVAVWQALSSEEKAPWNSEAKALGDPWSGYTLFMSTFIGEPDMSHDLFSETHPDTVPAVPVAGDIIYANATPKWTKLAKGAAGKVLKMGANLPAWTDLVMVTRHLIIDPKRFKLPAANYPGESFEGLFYTLDFDKNTEQSAYCQEHVPYRWDSSTDIEVAVSWLHDGVDAGKVVWGIEYKAIKAGEAVTGAGTIITQASPGNHPAGLLVRTTFTTKILHTNLEQDDEMAMRLFRKAADGDDTLAEDARVINIHIHFTMNALGKAI